MKILRCSLSDTAIIVHAVSHANLELLSFTLDILKCTLLDLNFLAAIIHDPIDPQNPVLDYLFSKTSHISDKMDPITELDYGCTLSGIEYLMDNELLVEGVLSTVSGVVKPEVLFYLRDRIFPLDDTKIITCVCMHDSSHHYDQMMEFPDIMSGLVTDEDLVNLCVVFSAKMHLISLYY